MYYSPYLNQFEKALKELDRWRKSYDGDYSVKPEDNLEAVLLELTTRLKGNYPFHHPRYAGQMLKPPHPVAWLAYSLAMTINPNNHALDGGPPTSEMEKEVMQILANMVGYDDHFLGHLTTGGTIANLEALFIAREIHPEKAIASSANAHYTHARMCHVLGVRHLTVPTNPEGMPDPEFIADHVDEIGTLVVTTGTTGLGIVEPLHTLLQITENSGIRIHLDAAYGGFFKILQGSGLIADEPWKYMSLADSIVIDPHKHGLQPYGCGSVLFKDPAAGRFYKHDSPYTYFTSGDLHLGEISLECSRAGASAAALWATFKLLPPDRSSGLGTILSSCRKAAVLFSEAIDKSNKFRMYNKPDLDICAYFPNPKENSLSQITALSKSIFEKGMQLKESGFYLSLYKVPSETFCSKYPDYTGDEKEVTILRSVLMKPEHEDFIPELTKMLEESFCESI